ncbi:MAG: hypothetical protein ACQXXG_05595 [Candidatus Bathyarchaeia archaeon]
MNFRWNTSNVEPANYTISANATLTLTSDDDSSDNIFVDDIVTIKSRIQHDVAVINVTPLKTIVGQNYTLHINVTLANQGDFTETFNVTVYANMTEIKTQEITITNGETKTITFTWNTTGFAKGNYTLWAYAWPVQGETNFGDNTLVDGRILVTIPGDVVAPYFEVDIFDVTAINICYDQKIGDPLYQPDYDINSDGIIDIYDVTTANITYGQKDP